MSLKFLNEIKYWGQVFLIPIYWLSYLMPRSKKIWVLGSTFGRRFADNPKYFYLYLNQYQKDNVRVIWITKNKEIEQLLKDNNLEAYYLYTLKGIWYALRAKVYLYDNYSKDISFTLSGGALKINLWHGIPLKKIQKDNLFDRVRNPRTKLEKWRWSLRRMSDEKPSNYVLTTSEFLKPIFSSAFNTENVIVCGYPRNDILIQNKISNILTSGELDTYSKIVKRNEKVVLYMPTFRESEFKLLDILVMADFNDFLMKHNIIFCIKMHPKSKVENYFKKIENDVEYKNIILIDSSYDPYPFLNVAEILVTDYSSIYFDFLLKRKPIIFFDYDRKEYLTNSREMYFDYDVFTPGVKVHTMAELESALLQDDIYIEERNNIKKSVFNDNSNESSEMLYQQVIQILNKSKAW